MYGFIWQAWPCASDSALVQSSSRHFISLKLHGFSLHVAIHINCHFPLCQITKRHTVNIEVTERWAPVILFSQHTFRPMPFLKQTNVLYVSIHTRQCKRSGQRKLEDTGIRRRNSGKEARYCNLVGFNTAAALHPVNRLKPRLWITSVWRNPAAPHTPVWPGDIFCHLPCTCLGDAIHLCLNSGYPSDSNS